MDQRAVRETVLSCGSVDPGNPQRPKLTLALLAALIGVHGSLLDRLTRKAGPRAVRGILYRMPSRELLFHPDLLAGVAFDDLAAHCESDTRALIFASAVQALEHGEYAVQVRLVEADAVIFHTSPQWLIFLATKIQKNVDMSLACNIVTESLLDGVYSIAHRFEKGLKSLI